MRYDVVYILKQNIDTEELRYSLRTVERNFPYNKVWFFCGCPSYIKPDGHVSFRQTGNTKWQRATSTFRKICDTPEVSDDFWLFNDDFFILEPVDELPYMYRGTLSERINGLRKRYNISSYSNMLDSARRALEDAGLDTLDYALHVPMLINKERAMEVLNAFPFCPMFRPLYGNYWKVGGIKVPDVKVYDMNVTPPAGQTLLSTLDAPFEYGAVGKYIRRRFTEPSRWENNNAKDL